MVFNQVDGQSLVTSHFCLLVLVLLNTLDQGRSRIGLSGGWMMTDDEVWKQPSMGLTWEKPG